MKDGFIKVSAVSPEIKVADVEFNKARIIEAIEKASVEGVVLLVLPELAVTSYSCEDLFLQSKLLESAETAIVEIAKSTEGKNLVAVVGLPLSVNGLLYNAAAVLCGGKILGFVPKSFIPNYTEFYEGRRFSKAPAENGEGLRRKLPLRDKTAFPLPRAERVCACRGNLRGFVCLGVAK